MKYFVTPTTDLISDETAMEWGIEKVFVVTSDFKNGLSILPEEKDGMIFFIPTVFTYQNSLNYEGVTLALKIFFHYLRIGRTDVDIILVGNESEIEFLLQYDYPNILKIPGFSYLRFNKKRIKGYEIPQRRYIKREEYKLYLENLGLTLPSSFKSTHSLTNEWCLYKWNSFMGFNETISDLEGLLYLDYLLTIDKLNKVKDKKVTETLKDKIKNLPFGSRILLIDDNIKWHIFFANMFTNCEFKSIGEKFKKQNYIDIQNEILDEINSFDPDIILLDFRLMEDKDREVNNPSEISGAKILHKLKGTLDHPGDYFGYQILMFTATSRIENILYLRENFADGFILKETPENYTGKLSTEIILEKMVSDLSVSSERANFIIPVNEYLNEIERETAKISDLLGVDFHYQINTDCKILRNLLQFNSLNEGVLKATFLTFINFLEHLKRIDETYFRNNYKDLDDFLKSIGKDLNFKTDTINLSTDLREIRNKIAHGEFLNLKKINRYNKYKDLEILLKESILDLGDYILSFISKYLDYIK